MKYYFAVPESIWKERYAGKIGCTAHGHHFGNPHNFIVVVHDPPPYSLEKLESDPDVTAFPSLYESQALEPKHLNKIPALHKLKGDETMFKAARQFAKVFKPFAP